ncbi:exodeoxyribonuclease VII small subunit [Paraburkholderia bonniea]|uniref:exodeoxyribonuclease VII small subunit n=1 Tax=Paraburkholderia bonniea TaxID=2152891 RepID=UPI001291D7D4|nr:exodeoxyribonuclease VII small subunit [Paraburkholderia bonniea]WJF91426.1 exodeoxyribonuclease VII small subunit [Paraburkholderia bonniea]WJF94744.1 exodeoxyribonuclease VII small subunit [Paraburkholderia bonniea]
MTAAAKTTGKSAATPGQQGSGAAGLPLPVNYEAALAELEELVARMEDGSLSLEASLAAYRRGAALVTFCQQQLEAVEQQVRVLDGETLKPLSTHPAGTLAAESGDDL